MANYTQHYQLHQWEPNDNFLRTDFNGDFEKIDTALGGMVSVVYGTYTGSSDYMNSSQDIHLGWKPQALLVFGNKDTGNEVTNLPAQMAIDGYESACLTITEQGFTVQNSMNLRPCGPFRYWAVR